MGTTAGGLPYPDGTAKVVDGDNAMKALAEAVDRNPYSALARAVGITYNSGWSATGGGMRLIAVNGWAFMWGRMSRASGTSSTPGSIPAAFYPFDVLRFPAEGQVGVVIDTSGAILLDQGIGSGALTVVFTQSWPLKGA